ncbi:MAG: hydrolase, partial [Alphaproteobacteria bacterium]|nr:hydrolase [Alphaproteobacteria bacterium]
MSAISEAETALLEHTANAPMQEQVQSWAAINSGSRNLTGLANMAAHLADAFSVLPGTLCLVESDPVETILPDGNFSQLVHGQHLHLNVRPQAPVRILLTGHMDTVFGIDHPFQEQKWVETGILNGPGVADMKSGIAIMLAALNALETSPLAQRIGYEVIINSDEEVGSPSSARLLMQAAHGKMAAFTYEPALPDGTLAGARAGSGNFSFMIKGKSAHAGRNPDDGRNALVAAADLALRLKRASGAGFSCNPAKIDGGGPNNVVPDHAILRVNFRPRTPDDEGHVKALLDSCIAAVATEHGVSIHLHGGFGRPPKPMDEKAERLFGLVRQCGADLGLAINWRDTGGVCDGNNIAACGVPVVDTMGARGGA